MKLSLYLSGLKLTFKAGRLDNRIHTKNPSKISPTFPSRIKHHPPNAQSCKSPKYSSQKPNIPGTRERDARRTASGPVARPRESSACAHCALCIKSRNQFRTPHLDEKNPHSRLLRRAIKKRLSSGRLGHVHIAASFCRRARGQSALFPPRPRVESPRENIQRSILPERGSLFVCLFGEIERQEAPGVLFKGKERGRSLEEVLWGSIGGCDVYWRAESDLSSLSRDEGEL